MKLFVDVRESSEYEHSHLSGALNIPLTRLLDGTSKIDLLPKIAEIVLYCNTGRRSTLAVPIFKQAGFTNVINGKTQQNIKANLLP